MQVKDLMWRGAETIDAAMDALARGADVALHLPAGMHHAVAAHFPSAQAPANIETLDVSGGAELLGRFERITGLERLAELQAPAARAHARVRIVSPSPTVAIRCSGNPAAGAA